MNATWTSSRTGSHSRLGGYRTVYDEQQARKITTSPCRQPAVTMDEIGNTSRGQYTLFRSAEFDRMLAAPEPPRRRSVHESRPT